MDKKNSKIEIKAALEKHIHELYEEMAVICQKYWEGVLKLEKQHPGAKYQNRVRIRCVKKPDSPNIRAEWYFVEWKGKGKDGKPYEKLASISKPLGSPIYTLSKLYAKAHEWEKEIILETETKMAEYRAEVRAMMKSLISLRHATDHEKKRLGGAVK
jgi:hypothetical protein